MNKIGSWMLICFLIFSVFSGMFISIPNDTAIGAINPSGIFLIDEPSDYITAGFEPDIYPIYTDDSLIDFYMPIALKKEDVSNLQDSDISHTILHGNTIFDERFNYIDFEILSSSTYWVVLYHMNVKASDQSFSIDFVPKIKGEELYQFAWWNSSWQKRKDIYIDKDQVRANLINFPILVKVVNDADFLDNVQVDGGDIIFVSSDNTTSYNHQIESFSIGAGVSFEIWVKIPLVNGTDESADTHLNMYYHNPTIGDQQNPAGVWDANYLAVYHMNASTGGTKINGCFDSTNNSNHATFNGTLPSQTTGRVGYGQSFDGNDDWIYVPDGAKTYLDGTWETFVRPNDTVNPEVVIEDRFDSTNYLRLTIRQDLTPDRWDYACRISGGDQWAAGVISNSKKNDWHGYGQQWADTDEACLWLNGTNRVIDSGVDTSTLSNTDMFIGALSVGTNDFDGVIDEVRISNVKRNDSWMEASYNSIQNYTTFTSLGSEASVTTVTLPVSNPTAVTMSLTNITLDWTQSSNGNYTMVEYNIVSSWSRGYGTQIYNGTDDNHSEYNLTARTQYFFKLWAFNESTHNFSDVINIYNHTGPINPTNTLTNIDSGTLNFTWTKGVRSQNTVIMRKANSFPTVVGDGTEIYNGSAVGYDDTVFTTDMRYTIFAHNTTCNLSSIGDQVEWGALQVRVFDENTSVAIRNFTVLVSNLTGTETYEIYSANTQIINIDINDLPTGENVIVKINATVYINSSITHEYEDRIYYIDIYPNTFYNLTAYLAKVVDSFLYRLKVVGPKNDYGADPPIEDANVNIKRYINSTYGWDSIGIYITDGDGNIYIYLIPGELYKVTVTADGYLTDVSDYIPSSSVFEQSFRLTPTSTDSITYDDFYDDVSIVIEMVSAGCWQSGNITITYFDSNSSTTNTQIRLYEIYGLNVTLLNTWDNVSASFFNINGSINTTRMHYITLYFNTTADYIMSQPVTIMILNVDLPFCGEVIPFDLDDRIDDIIGPFTIGDKEIPWPNIIAIALPIIVLISFGPFNTGLGIIGCGMSMAMMQGFLNTYLVGGFNFAIAGIGVFIVVIGILYIMTKGTGVDQL